ncbi:MAG: transcriptional regulator GcvA [Alphaproteobacteria bacterium]
MPTRLPPLNALRAFESAARHRSFSRAANELNVTPAAVSHQIKALEDFLGVALFRRDKRMLMLSRAGQSLLPGVSKGFSAIRDAMAAFYVYDQTGMLTVSVPPSFAANWLMHRLEHFNRKHPEIDVRISSSMDLVDFERDNIDIAVRYGDGHYPGLVAEHLLSDSVVPVCSPRLLQSERPLRVPADLRNFTLLHDDRHRNDATFPNWPMWLRAAGVTDVEASHGLRFDTASAVQAAAAEGIGVALGRTSLMADDIAAGRLVRLFDVELRSAFAYHLVYPELHLKRSKVKLFRDWILTETDTGANTERQSGGSAAA